MPDNFSGGSRLSGVCAGCLATSGLRQDLCCFYTLYFGQVFVCLISSLSAELS